MSMLMTVLCIDMNLHAYMYTSTHTQTSTSLKYNSREVDKCVGTSVRCARANVGAEQDIDVELLSEV